MNLQPKKLLLGIFALSLCASPLLGKSTLKVQCVDQNGAPLDDVKVYIQLITEDKTDDEDSNKQGIATFKGLKDGHYRVWAHQQGFAPSYYEFIGLQGNEEKTVELKFEPGDAQQSLYFEDLAIVERADQLLREGTAALQNQNFDEALSKYNESLALYPNQPLVYHNLGITYVNMQKWDLAEETFDKEIALIEELSQAGVAPSQAVLDQQIQQAKELKASIPFRRLALEADAAMKAKDYELALQKLEEISKINPDNPQVYFTRSLALTQLKRWDEAEQSIDQALALKPDDENLQSFKAQIQTLRENALKNRERNAVAELAELNKEKKYQEVLDKFAEVEAMVEAKELRPIMWREKAQAHLDLKQYPEALAALGEAWKLEDQPVDAQLYQLGQNFATKGFQDAARMTYERILEINPEFSEAYYELGMEYFYGTGEKDKAREFLEKYVATGSDSDHISNAKNVLAVMDHQKK